MSQELIYAVGLHRGDYVGIVDLFAADASLLENYEELIGDRTIVIGDLESLGKIADIAYQRDSR